MLSPQSATMQSFVWSVIEVCCSHPSEERGTSIESPAGHTLASCMTGQRRSGDASLLNIRLSLAWD